MNDLVDKIDGAFRNGVCTFTAREVMQQYTYPKDCVDIPLPKPHVSTKGMPANSNVYSDGSLKNPRGVHWHFGGIGIFYPGRNSKNIPITEKEMEKKSDEAEEWYQQAVAKRQEAIATHCSSSSRNSSRYVYAIIGKSSS